MISSYPDSSQTKIAVLRDFAIDEGVGGYGHEWANKVVQFNRDVIFPPLPMSEVNRVITAIRKDKGESIMTEEISTAQTKSARRKVPTETFGKGRTPVVVEIKVPGIGTVNKSKVYASLEQVRAAIRAALEQL